MDVFQVLTVCFFLVDGVQLKGEGTFLSQVKTSCKSSEFSEIQCFAAKFL